MNKGERDPARLCNIGLAALGPVITDTRLLQEIYALQKQTNEPE